MLSEFIDLLCSEGLHPDERVWIVIEDRGVYKLSDNISVSRNGFDGAIEIRVDNMS